MGFAPSRAPIAQVAADTSAAAALQDLAGEVKRAKEEGRLIQALPVDAVDEAYLVRDRILTLDDEMRALMDSIAARGQQTPIEVVDLGQGRYGLISGWRRLTALKRLHARTGEDRYAQVQAVLRRPDTAADAYVAMVEENEIRVGLSYYERARVTARAVEQGVYLSDKQALGALFGAASRTKRSKIKSFLTLYRAADDALRHGPAIPERLGLALARALDEDEGRAGDLRAALAGCPRETADEEIACLEAALAGFAEKQSRTRPSGSKPGPKTDPVSGRPVATDRPARGIDLAFDGARIVLSGPGVTPAFRDRLAAWLAG